MTKLRLHSYRRCPFAIRVRMTLAEKGIPYTLIEENLAEPSAELLKLHPEGLVPLLIHGELVVYESAIITEYLDESFGGPKLMPNEATKRAQARLWTHWCNQIFKPDLDLFKYERSRMAADEIEALNRRLTAHLEKLERQLSKSRYLVGDEMSLADIHVFPFYRQFARITPAFAKIESFARANAWLEMMTSRPSFSNVMEKT